MAPGSDEVVVFDIDDTLYLERDYVASGFAAVDRVVRDHYGVEGFRRVAWRIFEEGFRGNIFDRTLAELGVTPASGQVGALVDAYRAHRPNIALTPDALTALEHLRRSGQTVAFLSDGPIICQATKVASLGLNRYADVIVLTGAYEGTYGKPHPRGFIEVADRLGASRFTYVADNPHKDFIAPRQLGWRTVRICRKGGLHEALGHDPSEVDVLVTDLSMFTK